MNTTPLVRDDIVIGDAQPPEVRERADEAQRNQHPQGGEGECERVEDLAGAIRDRPHAAEEGGGPESDEGSRKRGRNHFGEKPNPQHSGTGAPFPKRLLVLVSRKFVTKAHIQRARTHAPSELP